MQPVMQIHMDVVKGLSNYYYTFVDVMIFKVLWLLFISYLTVKAYDTYFVLF